MLKRPKVSLTEPMTLTVSVNKSLNGKKIRNLNGTCETLQSIIVSAGIWGDSHYYRLFQTQILAGTSNSAGAGVADIRDSGEWKVSFCYHYHIFRKKDTHLINA